MSDEQHDERIADLFARAKNLSVEDQARLLEEECRNDPPDVRQQLERLLAADRQLHATTIKHEATDQVCGLHIRCPHCHNPIELVPDAELDSICCPSCGSNFSLVGEVAATKVADQVAQVGHFRLIERVGMGAFGSVWKAHDTKLDRTVAVKIPRSGQFDEAQEKAFIREARSAAQLNHPGIVRVHEVGRDGDTIYIASEFVRGLTLSDWLSGQRPNVREAAALCAKIAIALHHAHEQGIVHRDMKPGNIMLDGDGEPHLMDFGLAKRSAGEITMTVDGQVLGTPAYMSPEQAQGDGHGVDHRSDIYSLGVILYQLLTGELPFRGNARMLMHQVIHDEPRSPRRLNDRIPRDLETVCLKAMAKEPARRYSTAAEMADDLGRFLHGQPVVARPITRIERAWRWSKRQPVVASLLGAVILSLAAGTIVSTVFAIRATLAENDARSKLSESYLAQARALTVSRRPGQRFEALEAIRKAVAITGPSAALADEAVAALCLTDMVPLREWNGIPGAHRIALDRELIRYAQADKENHISVRLVADNTEVTSISALPGLIAFYKGLEFSPNGRFLHIRFEDGGVTPSLLYELEEAGARLVLQDDHNGFAFSPDSRQIAARYRDNTLRVLETETGKEVDRFNLPYDSGFVWWNPERRMLAIDNLFKSWTTLDLESGTFGPEVKMSVSCVAWHPNGRDLAVATSGNQSIRLFDVATRRPVSPKMISSARSDGLIIWFNRRGNLLITNDWSQLRQLWDPYTGRELLKLPAHDQNFFQFGPTDEEAAVSIFGQKLQLLRVATGSEERVVASGLSRMDSLRDTALSLDGRLLAVRSDAGLAIFDALLGRKLHEIRSPLTVRLLGFETSGALRAFVGDRLYKWSVNWQEDAKLLRVAAPEILLRSNAGLGGDQSRDGRIIAVTVPGQGNIVHLGPKSHVLSIRRPDQDIRGCSVSPDGRYLATANWGPSEGENTCVWSTATGELVKSFYGGGECNVRFSPNGKWLAVASRVDGTCQLWRTDSWAKGPKFHELWLPAFSPDDDVLAFGAQLGVIHLYETKTGRKVGRVSSRDAVRFSPLCFSPDGTRLYALSDAPANVHIWDLAEIHSGLKNLGLAEGWSKFQRAGLPKAAPDTFTIECEADESLDPLFTLTGHAADETVITILQKLVEQFPTVPVYQQDLARSHYSLGNQLSRVGKNDAARAAYEASVTILKKLVEQFPAVPLYQQDLARSYQSLGYLLSDVGDQDAARAAYEAELAIQKKMVEQFPAVPEFQQDLARSHHNLGKSLRDLGNQDAARAAYETGLAIRKKLVEQFPAVPQYQQDLARSHYSMALLLSDLGEEDAARAAHEAGLAIRKKLVEQFPTVPTYQEELARSYGYLGNQLRDLDDQDAARAAYEAGLAIQKKLVKQFPAVRQYQQNLAWSHNSLGWLLWHFQDQDGARVEYEAEVAIRKKLVEQFPAVPEDQQGLARSHNNLGKVLSYVGEQDAARAAYEAGLAIYKQLVEESPDVEVYQVELGDCYYKLGELVLQTGKPGESLEYFDMAVQVLQTVHNREPRNPTAKEFLRHSHHVRAHAYDLLRRHAEGLQDFNRAIELSAPTEQLSIRACRAGSQAKAGLVAEAVAEVAELTQFPNVTAGGWYDFACVYSIASAKDADKRQEYADRAIELLRKAIEAGYKNAEHLKTDPDLEPLHDREDFQKLVAELEAAVGTSR
jgi:serine/threonine protein kinase/WD40 repeat protein/tetratricopeptide (TPR) repeat protein